MGYSDKSYTNLICLAGLFKLIAFCMVVGLIASASAFSTPTSLNVVPTAEVLDHGEGSLAVQFAGGPTSSGYTFFNELQTQFGLGHKIEVGYDQALPPSGPSFWNAKYHIYDETRRRPALAVGLWSSTDGVRDPFYITAFKTDGEARLHAGAIQEQGTLRLMLGWESRHREPLVFQADYISGPRMYASVGLVYNLPNGVWVNAAQLIGNSADAANMYLVVVGWTDQLF